MKTVYRILKTLVVAPMVIALAPFVLVFLMVYHFLKMLDLSIRECEKLFDDSIRAIKKGI